MELIIKIRRQASASDKAYYESFRYEGDGKLSVADFLKELNECSPILTADGETSSKIVWECSCNEMKCGACAMLINDYPRLACSINLCDAAVDGEISLAPLSKFPLVKDLKVDRASMFEMLEAAEVWADDGSPAKSADTNKLKYQASQCAMCGCCLEICPNFLAGERFGGAALLVAEFKAMKHTGDKEHYKRMKSEYNRHYFAGCSMAFSCIDACPFGIPIDRIRSRIGKKERDKRKC